MVEVGRGEVHDHQPSARFLGVDRHVGRRVHDERGSHYQEHAGCRGAPLGLLHRQRRHGLPEEDGVGLDDPATGGTSRHVLPGLQPLLDRVPRDTGATVEAAHASRVAVQLDDLLGRDARPLVQVVDVLGHDAVQESEPIEGSDGLVGRVRPGTPDRPVQLPTHRPVPPAPLGRGHEALVGEVLGTVAGPDPGRAAEVRNAGFGGDARPGEDEHTVGGSDQLHRPFDLSVETTLEGHPVDPRARRTEVQICWCTTSDATRDGRSDRQ